MIRGQSETGALFIGLLRGPLTERLLAGERVCIPRTVDPTTGMVHPHVCLFLRDDDDQLLAAVQEYFPDGFMPGAGVYRAGEEPK